MLIYGLFRYKSIYLLLLGELYLLFIFILFYMEKLAAEIPTLDAHAVIEEILAKGVYTSENAKIKEWNSYVDPKKKEFKDQYLLSTLTEGKFKYTGLLNQNLQRESIGIQKYDNGDLYIGQWTNNERNGLGVYLYNEQKKGKNHIIEMSLGKWVNGKKEKEGLYVWIEENEKNNDLMESDFEAYIGELDDVHFKRGIYLTKIKSNFYIYYGAFENGKKTDDKCYFYDNNGEIDRVFRGKVKEGQVQEGFFITFHKEAIDDTAYMKFENNTPVEVSTKEMLGEKLVDEINKESFDFREILYEEDWFGMIYDTCKAAHDLLEKNKMEDFDTEKGFNEIVKIVGSYKGVTLYPKLCEQMK